VAGRVSPTERARAEIDELFASDPDLALILEEVARLSVRLLLQTALEAEVEAFLGRARYQRRTEEHPAGVRNGWQPPTAVKTTMGPVELQRPKLRAADQAFCSRLFGAGVTRTNALESLVISGWVRGLSDRDIEAALAEVLGAEAALSRSTVSRICQRIKTSSRDGAPATCPVCGWTTCSWTPRTSRCTRAHRPSRCWPPGASTPTASRCSSGWPRPARSRPTPGTTSSPI
jgi:putative transposase